MKIFGMAVGLSALLAAGSANATLVYDTITGNPAPTSSLHMSASAGHGPIGDSFIATGSESITSVTIELKDLVNTDGGSVLVYLVPNSPSLTGAPNLPSTSAGTVVLTGATLLGTILDSAIPSSYTGITVTPTSPVSIAGGTYWIELVSGKASGDGNGNTSDTSALWGFNSTTAGIGVPGSGNLYSMANSSNTAELGFTNGTLGLQIQATPEPASLALLGAGLVGLGFGRRRRAKKPTV